MERIVLGLATLLTATAFGGGALAAIYLSAEGELPLVAAGIVLMIVGWVAAEAVAYLATKLRRHAEAGGSHPKRCLLGADLLLFVAMTGWAACVFFEFSSHAANPIALELWFYAVTILPWVIFERRQFERNGSFFLARTPPSPLLFFEVACLGCGALSLAADNRCAVFSLVGAIMLASLLLEAAETISAPATVRGTTNGAVVATPRIHLATAALVMAICAVFVVDLMMPAGIGDGTGYAPLLVLCVWVPGRRALLATACLTTILVVAAYFLVQTSDVGIAGTLFNRAISVATIWVVYLLLSRRSLLAAALRAAETRLSARAEI